MSEPEPPSGPHPGHPQPQQPGTPYNRPFPQPPQPSGQPHRQPYQQRPPQYQQPQPGAQYQQPPQPGQVHNRQYVQQPPTDPEPDIDAWDESSYSITGAVTYAWRGITQGIGPLLMTMAISGVGFLVILGVRQVLAPVAPALAARMFMLGGLSKVTILTALLAVMLMVWVVVTQGMLSRSALRYTEGLRPEASSVFAWSDMKPLMRLGFLFAAPIMIAGILAIIGRLSESMAAFGTMLGALSLLSLIPLLTMGGFATFFVQKDMTPSSAMGASILMTADKGGQVVRLYLLSVVILVLGALLLGVGLLVAWPMVVYMQAYAFKKLRKRPVAAWE